MSLQGLFRTAIKSTLKKRGYDLVRTGSHKTKQIDPDLARFKATRRTILNKHSDQTPETISYLNAKYQEPVFGEIRVWELLQRLAYCIDPTDTRLLNTSQYVHVLQVLEAMEKDDLSDPVWYLAAVVHDLGKLLLLTPEAPENVVCLNTPIGETEPEAGLDNTVMQWNHDEFAYMRLKDYVPDEVAWLIRYHSIDLGKCEPCMDKRDRMYRDKYLLTFRRYDFGSKSPYHFPRPNMEKYRAMIEEAFPDPIPF